MIQVRKILHFAIATLLLTVLAACSKQSVSYRIGVSQCSSDIWRNKLIDELRTANYSRADVSLSIVSANDNDQRQIAQIDSLIAAGVDLLIVSPNQVSTISPAIDRAYQKGIRVILFDRKTDSPNYTAFMGADNYAVGHAMGEYIASQLDGRGRVLEIMGLRGSSPAIDRHRGFTDALRQYPGITFVDSLQGDWTEESGYEAMQAYLSQHPDAQIDYVFGQNDRMALGARKASLNSQSSARREASERTLNSKYCGIDALATPDGGIEHILSGDLEASYIYPTRGDELFQLAMNILEDKPYERDNQLKAAIVTRDNANVMLMQSEEMMRQGKDIENLHSLAADYMQRLTSQRMITLLSLGIILLLAFAAFLIWRDLRTRIRINKEHEQMARQQIDFYTQAAHQLRTPLTLITGPLQQLAQTEALRNDNTEAHAMLDIVTRNADQLSELVNKILKPTLNSENSPLGKDGVFTPSATEDTDDQQGTAPTPAEGEAESDPLSILVVDDNPDIRTYLRTILAPFYTISEAPDGKQGLEIAQRDVPDLIVSDVMMPVMNGLEFCQQVKESLATSHIPVILLTARALSQHQVEGYRSGADAYITKPFEASLLLARIENLLRSRRILKELWGGTSPTPIEGGENLPDDGNKVENIDTNSQTPPAEVLDDVSPFLARFKAVVEKHMTDSDLSVEELGAEIGLSRVQLYRKVKALTGRSPVELLRTARLQRARQMLLTTDKTIAEVAYDVGFSAPSYFTKCFRDEFGISPSELNNKQ